MLKIGVVTNNSDDTESYKSSLDLNNLKECKIQQPRKKKLDLDRVKMNYYCRWGDCDYEISCLKSYFHHVSEHVDYLWTEEWQSNKESMLPFFLFLQYSFKKLSIIFRMVFMFME